MSSLGTELLGKTGGSSRGRKIWEMLRRGLQQERGGCEMGSLGLCLGMGTLCGSRNSFRSIKCPGIQKTVLSNPVAGL